MLKGLVVLAQDSSQWTNDKGYSKANEQAAVDFPHSFPNRTNSPTSVLTTCYHLLSNTVLSRQLSIIDVRVHPSPMPTHVYMLNCTIFISFSQLLHCTKPTPSTILLTKSPETSLCLCLASTETGATFPRYVMFLQLNTCHWLQTQVLLS